MNKDNTLTIRKTTHEDVEAAMEVINLAKEDMKASGSDQWQNGTPNADMLHADVDAGKGYVLEDHTGHILGTAFISNEDDPTYHVIREGSWHSSEPYTVIHRIAVRRSERGKGLAWHFFRHAIDYSKERNVHWLRIDTHPLNTPMQHFLARHGFEKCGIIQISDGIRIAYDYQIKDC